MSEQNTPVRGIRFAPSPTGRLHLGNLRTAWVSERIARALGEPWVVRFEDIDGPRVLRGAQDQQLADLRALGLVPDRVVVQSDRLARHREWFERARAAGAIYPCRCSRREVQEELARMASAPQSSFGASNSVQHPVYSGHCRTLPIQETPHSHETAWRFKMPDPSGAQDFVIARMGGAGFQPAYHWACAIDDWEGRYRLLVRAIDLAPAWDAQRALMQWMGSADSHSGAMPGVFHTRMVVAADGSRLEKRTRGVTLAEAGVPLDAVRRAMERSFEMATELGRVPALGEANGESRVGAALSVTDLLR